ncbi:MAG: hypothetical protein HBSAPP03_12330 [Phycisphaerae bacterium]|nr:MAG: hypothetical protein HBSAPP03_12330 [Phycisphaerae bacterium]
MIHLIVTALLVVPGPVDSLPALRQAAMAAKPGDRVELACGVYEGSLWLDNLRGQEGAPVIIAGADPANPPILRGRTECIHLVAPAWVTLENLILENATGNGLNIDDGGITNVPAQGVTLRSIRVRDIGPDGNADGIKLSGLTNFTLEGCTIERWGRGGSGIDMVGCANGVIRDCVLRGDGGADAVRGASGIQMKGGSRDISVQACRFERAGARAVNIGGSTGLQYFRPAPRGYEAAAITVEGCTFVGSDAAVAFVGVDGATVRFNTIIHPTRWVFRILQETRAEGFVPCRGGSFSDNLVVVRHPAARHPNIGDGTSPETFTFARNVWYCESDPSASRPTLPTPERDGVYGQDPRLIDPAQGNFTPAPDGPAAKAGAGALTTPK